MPDATPVSDDPATNSGWARRSADRALPGIQAALDSGTGKACIIDGREAHSLILELFTSQGIGTEVVR